MECSASSFVVFTSILLLSVRWLCCIDIISHEELSRPIFICSPILGQQHCNTRENIGFGQQKSKKTDLDTKKTCQHSCMWPLSNVWRLETDAECWVLPRPGPPQAETHWQKWLMMCALPLLAWAAPVNGPVSDLTWRGSPLAPCTPCTPPWARYWPQLTIYSLDCRHMAAPTCNVQHLCLWWPYILLSLSSCNGNVARLLGRDLQNSLRTERGKIGKNCILVTK